MTEPRIVAVLSWYSEDPVWLSRCVRSLEKVPVDLLIALDGPYDLFTGSARSSDEEWKAIATAGSFSTRVRSGDWQGNEIEKRNHLFELAEHVTNPADWYLVIDADEEIVEAPDDMRQRLAASVFDVAAVTLIEPGHPLGTIVFPTHPKLFRAIRGLRCVGNHFTYQCPDGRKLWGNAKTDRLEPRLDLTDLRVRHHKMLRHPDRKDAADAYYRTRDAHGIEDIPVDRRVLAA